MIQRIFSIFLAASMFACFLAGCSKPLPTNQGEVKIPDSPAGDVTLTMLGNLDEQSAQAFVAGVHENLPNITLEFEACPIGSLPYGDEITRRVMHDAEPDIFMTTDTNLWNSGKLLNLTNEEFVSKYNLSIMQTLSGDGSVYFLPSVGDVLCYTYNSVWLEELKLSPPQTLDELDDVFAAVKASGKHPFVVPYSQMPTLYVKVLIAGYLSTPKGQQWLNDYNQGNATMAQDEEWQQLWKHAEEMIEKGYLDKEDMVYTESRRMAMLQDGNGFMTTFSSGRGSNFSKEAKEHLQTLPLLGEKPENKMIYTAPTSYIAISDRLSAQNNSEKCKAALQLLEFISTQKGQELLQGKMPLAISYLANTNLPIDDKYSTIAEIIKKGAYTRLPTLERGVENVIKSVFADLINGTITAEAAIKACDKQNAEYIEEAPAPSPVIGSATEKFPWIYLESRCKELAVVNFCTDSMRTAAKTDYAIELGTAFRSEFFKGDITAADVEAVIRQDKKIHVVDVTGQQIWDIIAQGVVAKGSAWFIAPSGLSYSYQMAEGDIPGKLLTLTSQDGTAIEMQKSYTLAVSENQMLDVPNVINFSKVENTQLPFTLREAVTESIKAQGVIAPLVDGRIEIVGK